MILAVSSVTLGAEEEFDFYNKVFIVKATPARWGKIRSADVRVIKHDPSSAPSYAWTRAALVLRCDRRMCSVRTRRL